MQKILQVHKVTKYSIALNITFIKNVFVLLLKEQASMLRELFHVPLINFVIAPL